jgi:hypothetical protein
MASKRTGRKFLHDNLVNARRASVPRPQRVTIISGGMRYAPGQDPVRVCPAGSVPAAGARVGSGMLRRL